MKTYYYPINIENLFVVFTTGVIAPTSLYGGTRITDVQTANPDFLLLSSAPISMGEEYCSLKILLTSEEENTLIAFGKNLALFPLFLPVSRVSQIQSKQTKKFKKQISLIEENTAYIPSHLLAKESKKERNNFDESCIEDMHQENPHLPMIKERLDLYNRILGGISLALIAGLEGEEIADKLISILCNYCDLNASEIPNYLTSPLFLKIKDVIYSGLIVDENTIQEMAYEEKVNIPVSGTIIKKKDYSQLPMASASRILYVLYNYKSGDYDNDGLGTSTINAIISDKFASVGVVTAFCYGVHRGYEIFNKQYMDVPVKFRLDSRKDYLIIESIYHYVMTGKILDSYSYLDEITTRFACDKSEIKENQFDLFGETFTIKGLSGNSSTANIPYTFSASDGIESLNEQIRMLKEQNLILQSENEELKRENQRLMEQLSAGIAKKTRQKSKMYSSRTTMRPNTLQEPSFEFNKAPDKSK